MSQTKSVLIARCQRCRIGYEVKAYQSRTLCEECQPPAKRCVHGIETTEACDLCFQIHRNRFLRVGVR